VNSLRHHLNHLGPDLGVSRDVLPDEDHTMTGLIMGGTLNAGPQIADDEDADGDEELEDGDATVPFFGQPFGGP
jgi:hypothetical protein